MCGRFTQRPTGEIAAIFAAQDRLNDLGEHFNVAPTQRIAVVVERPEGDRAVVGYRWGLVPSWTDRNVRAPTRMFNARSESVAAKPAFRDLLAKHRLLVPVDGFYEWRRGAGLDRQPYFIRRADGRPLALAGLWASWHDPEQPRDNDPLRSATVLTTVPNAFLGQIHNRMPGHPGRVRLGSLAGPDPHRCDELVRALGARAGRSSRGHPGRAGR